MALSMLPIVIVIVGVVLLVLAFIVIGSIK
jgi:hypothetical protein